MTLQIDPNTPKGEAQIEAIKWAQDQMNEILKQYFKGKYRIQKGLQLSFRFKLDSFLNEKINVDVLSLEPETLDKFNQAVAEAKAQLTFANIQEGEIVK